MTVLFPILLTFTVFAASFGFTAWARRLALAHLLLDLPNARSSHTIATPRGGGVAIVLTTLLTLVALGLTGRLAWQSVWSVSAGGALAALIGFVDDHRHVPPRWRLVGHFAA